MAKAMKRKVVGGKGRARPSSRGVNKGNVARRDITADSESEDDDDDDRLEKETEPRTPPSVNPGVAVTAENEGHAEAISELGKNSVGQEYYKYNNQMAELKAKLERLEAEVKKQQDLGPTSGLNGASIKKPEVLVNDHLRKFVAEKIFPGWKFIFNKEKLGRVVSAAVKQGYITKPDGVGEEEMRECYRRSVRTCLDGCRHNAQSAARRRFIGKLARDMLEVIGNNTRLTKVMVIFVFAFVRGSTGWKGSRGFQPTSGAEIPGLWNFTVCQDCIPLLCYKNFAGSECKKYKV